MELNSPNNNKKTKTKKIKSDKTNSDVSFVDEVWGYNVQLYIGVFQGQRKRKSKKVDYEEAVGISTPSKEFQQVL